ncbi:MAG TPA: FAD-dependent oxidoreductase [Pirellulales bacterium]|nr:FAD-dependent oxidoreductase [Pirellulales bacterium]
MPHKCSTPALFLCVALAACGFAQGRDPDVLDVDVLIYGGTPAGIAAALSAADAGLTVLLVEPYPHVGGLLTNGLTHPDFRTFEALTGTYYDITRRVERYYIEKYGADSQQVRDCLHGVNAEPRVNALMVEAMLAERKRIEVRTLTRLTTVEIGRSGKNRRIAGVTIVDAEGRATVLRPSMFIDATYEGDLMALAEATVRIAASLDGDSAGVDGDSYRVGRESRSEYDETFAPNQADEEVQGYSFRLTMTREPSNRAAVPAPAGYRREDFADISRLFEEKKLKTAFCDHTGGVIKAHVPPLPNAKHDMNDVSKGLVRLSMPGINYRWPDHSLERSAISAAQLWHNLGVIYFLQNDPSVPAKIAEEAREWGLCKDEFVDNAHLPEQLYVREARRLVGRYVFTEHDTDAAPDDVRSVLRTDAIAIGDYGLNCHGTSHVGSLIGGHHEGEFYRSVAPYQVPYGVIVPKDIENLLVPVACSSSHVGFCALRLEPIWTSLGQAAGVAAHLAIEGKCEVGSVSVPRMQQLLRAAHSATIYVSDVPCESPDFAAVQWWGTRGGLHGVSASLGKPGVRGEFIVGQYYKAYPGHAVELDKPLDAVLLARWTKLASDAGLALEPLSKASSRGEFIREAYRQHAASSPP